MKSGGVPGGKRFSPGDAAQNPAKAVAQVRAAKAAAAKVAAEAAPGHANL